MIVKIDIDDGIDTLKAIRLCHESIVDKKHVKANETIINGLRAKITHTSKAGNIFIHVSKVE